MVISLEAKARAATGAKAIREMGEVPAVVYGAGKQTQSVSVSLRDFQKVLKEAGETGTVSLTTPSGVMTVLIHEVVNDPVRHVPSHIDFLVVDVNKPIHVSVPIEFTGTAPAVKNGLGVLVKVMHEIEIKALPKDIPHVFNVDISSLENLDSQIAIKDLGLAAAIEVLAEEDAVVAAIAAIQEETEEPTGPIDFSQIEVAKKGKKDEEGESEAK